MKNCVLLSMDNLDEFGCYDSLLEKPMAAAGWKTHEISWRNKSINWNNFEAVIIRSCWDYQDHCEEFLKVLDIINESNAVLVNSLDVVHWNINKHYLKELQEQGVQIVPTIWESHYSEKLIKMAYDEFNTSNLIIKPCISANADDTFRLNSNSKIDHAKLKLTFDNREFMIQPFMPAIIDEGEFSLFFFNGEYSHAILKTPKTNDFRVQEEHGGQLKAIIPEEKLMQTAASSLQNIPYTTLYARLDFVRSGKQFAMMEAELIEPSLYFNLDKKSPTNFVNAFISFYDEHLSKHTLNK